MKINIWEPGYHKTPETLRSCAATGAAHLVRPGFSMMINLKRAGLDYWVC